MRMTSAPYHTQDTVSHLGEGDGAGHALGALDGGALPDLVLLQGLLLDGVQQRRLRNAAVLAQQRLQVCSAVLGF
jgi:hypothetical protein